MKRIPPVSLLVACFASASALHATEPDLTKLSVAEINQVQPPPEGLFTVPFHPSVPVPGSLIWGGMFLWWHDGTYYMTYDCWPNRMPLYLLTSTDGVHWKHEGAWFDKDNPRAPVLNPEIYKLKPDGPWVIAYQHGGMLGFATSDGDMWDWKRLGSVDDLAKNIQVRESFYPHSFKTPVSYPHPDGGWFHLVFAVNREYLGMGYARSGDGIHYEIFPPVRFEGVPCDRFHESPLMTKGGETAGITKIGDKYFFSGGSRQGDWFLVADKPEGPYRPTPKNHTIPRDPENFWRIYNDVPDGPLITPSVWASDEQGRRKWMMTPLKRLVSDGESVWIKWWEGNDLLKRDTIAIATMPTKSGVAMVEPALDFSKVTVIEAQLDFSAVQPELDFTKGATASATMTHTFGEGSLATGAEDYLGPQHLIDGRDERSWIGDLVGVYHADPRVGGMNEKEHAAFIAAKTGKPEATIDLGQVRPVGRIEARWTRCPGTPSHAIFKKEYIEATRLEVSEDGQRWQSIEPSILDDHRLNFESIGLRARYLKFTLPPLNHTADRLRNRAERISYRVTGLAEVNVYESPQHDITREGGLPGIVLEREGDLDEAILVDPSGKVLMGEVKRGESTFRHRETRNIEVPFPEKTTLRLVATGDFIEVYVGDYFIRMIQTKTPPTGRLLTVGGESAIRINGIWSTSTAD